MVVDETSDTAGGCEPVNIVVVTSEAAYFCDTVLIDGDREEGEKYGDAFGKKVVEWWDSFFGRFEPQDTCPLRYDVVAYVFDNVNYNIGAFKRQLKPRFPSAVHVKCVAHILNFGRCGIPGPPPFGHHV